MSPIREQKRKSSPSIGQAVFYPNSLPPPLRRSSKALPPYSSRPASPTSPSTITLATPPRQISLGKSGGGGSSSTFDRFDNASEYPFPDQTSLSPTRKLTHLFDGLSFTTPQNVSNYDTYNRLLYSAGSEPDLDITTPHALPLSDLINDSLIEDNDNHEIERNSKNQLFSSPAFIPAQDIFDFPQPPSSMGLHKSSFQLSSPPKQSFSPQSQLRLNILRQPSWKEQTGSNRVSNGNLSVKVNNQATFDPPSPLSGPAISPSHHGSTTTDYLFPNQVQGFNDVDVFSSNYQLNAPRPMQLNNQQLFTPPYHDDTELPTPTNSLHLHHPVLYPSAPVSQCPTPSITPPPLPAVELPKSEIAAHYLKDRKLCSSFSRRYIIRDELGSGGFGFVCSALQTGYKNQPGVEVAVKFIFKDRIQECDYAMLEGEPVESFVLARVRHPGIIGFKELYEDNEFFYLVQELHGAPWEPGHTLEVPDALHNPVPAVTPSLPMSIPTINPPQTPGSALLFSPVHSIDWSKLNPMNPLNGDTKNGGRPNMARRASYDLFECVEHQRFTEDQSRKIFRQIVDAVGYLHRRGIYHRDLKDENIVIDRNLSVKIIDFGSAVIEDPTQTPVLYDHFRGTMSYASAEVLNGRHYHAGPADIWSLGIILGIILTGESPFPNTTWAQDGRIKIKRQIPGGAFDLMTRCLHTDPRRRARIEEIERHPWLRGMLAHRGSIC
ncbi:hypothetical protein I203_108163 [Kwoniella mangroviensis CBS 8507]|uniref:hypothetical protein n=1 Tax=Kwoniella mangroviensis CBS 8507 TaxID=1296122 RepID=UPI00080CF639|nr:CAMK/CAMKL/PASK protein kinase [Kwoniella mangroviensis CBS 8507]OCF66034.1 CAMK/CAMKL/PASK protein kinase [Kwoniella mangroviensis CBS 8507]